MTIVPQDPPENVEKWIKSLKRVIKKMPSGIWLFANSSGLSVMALDKYGEHAKTGSYGMDPDYIIDSIHCDIDGGDW